MDRIPLDPESTSDILRATSIVEVVVEAARTSEWRVLGKFKVRDLDLMLRLIQVFKGENQAAPNSVFAVRTMQYAPAIRRFFAVPGAWSPYDPQPGERFVIFDIADTTIRVEPADGAVPDVERAVAAGVPELSIGATITIAAGEIANWGPLFARYLEARLPECFFEDLNAFGVYLAAMEDPRLEENLRFVLLSAAYAMLMLYDPAPDVFVARMLAATSRVLQMKSGAALSEAVFDTYVPNLLGITSGLEPKQAADVLNAMPSERSAVETMLAASGNPQLLTWMRS